MNHIFKKSYDDEFSSSNVCQYLFVVLFLHHLKRVPCKLIINNNLIRASHITLLIEQMNTKENEMIERKSDQNVCFTVTKTLQFHKYIYSCKIEWQCTMFVSFIHVSYFGVWSIWVCVCVCECIYKHGTNNKYLDSVCTWILPSNLPKQFVFLFCVQSPSPLYPPPFVPFSGSPTPNFVHTFNRAQYI